MEPRPASGYGRWPHSGYPAQPSSAPLSQQPAATPGGGGGSGGGGGGGPPPHDAAAQQQQQQQQTPPQPAESAVPTASSAPPPASSSPDASGGAGATCSSGGGGGGSGGGGGAPPPGVVPSPTAAAGGPADGGFPPAQQQQQQHHVYYGHAPPPQQQQQQQQRQQQQQLARPRVTSREELSYVADYVGIPLTTWQVDMLMKIGESYHPPQLQHHYQHPPRAGSAGGGAAAAAAAGWAGGGAGAGGGGGGAGSPPPPPHQQGPPPPPHQQQRAPPPPQPTHHGGGGGGGYGRDREVWNYIGPWGPHDGGDCAACHEDWCDAYKEEEFVKLDDSDMEDGSSEGEDVMPPLEKAPVVSVQSPGYTQGWWGRGREPDFGAVRNEQRLAKLLARRESRRRKDKLRRLDKDACRIKHERKVLHALSTQSVKEYQQDEIVQMCKDGSLLHKKANEVVFDYVVFNLPERGVITCPLSGLQKISSAVCVRRDLIRDGSGLCLTGCPALEGPQIISTREYTNLSKRDPPVLDPAVLEYVPDSEKEGYQLTNLANDILQTRKGPGNTTNVRQ